ncbi:hypothetical protein [Arthrobacter sp. KK5.5]|uniref:hypothetical protein n=1 Tax=Arthrobacter sp. KK5.5 TaxID=3373084 RepID=UPI003EE4BCB0
MKKYMMKAAAALAITAAATLAIGGAVVADSTDATAAGNWPYSSTDAGNWPY